MSPNTVEKESKKKWKGTNWPRFKALMLASFEEKNIDQLACCILRWDNTWSDEQKAQWKKDQSTLKRIILDALSETLSHHVVGKTTGTEMWEALCAYDDGQRNDPSPVQKRLQLQNALLMDHFAVHHNMHTSY